MHPRGVVRRRLWDVTAEPRRLARVPDPALRLAIDLEPLVDQVLQRLRPMLQQEATEARPAKRAYRTPEAAEALSLSVRETERLIATGELESIRVGRVRLVPASALDAFVERKLAK